MDLLSPLIGLGSLFFGSLFGNNTTQNTATTTNSSGASNTSQASGGTSSTAQSTTESQTSNSGSAGSTTGTTSQNTNQTSVGSTTRLDTGTKDALTTAIQGMLGSAIGSNTVLDSTISKTQDGFDPTEFVNGIMRQATAQQQNSVDSDIAKIGDATGAGADSNSAAALLKAKVQGDAAANLAGIKSQATSTAEQIKQGQNQSLTQMIGAQSSTLSQLIGGLLNAGETQTQNVGSNVIGSNATSQTSNTNTTTNGQSSTNQKSTTAQTQTGVQQTTSSDKSNEAVTQNKQDWTTFFSGLGKAFNTTF